MKHRWINMCCLLFVMFGFAFASGCIDERLKSTPEADPIVLPDRSPLPAKQDAAERTPMGLQEYTL